MSVLNAATLRATLIQLACALNPLRAASALPHTAQALSQPQSIAVPSPVHDSPGTAHSETLTSTLEAPLTTCLAVLLAGRLRTLLPPSTLLPRHTAAAAALPRLSHAFSASQGGEDHAKDPLPRSKLDDSDEKGGEKGGSKSEGEGEDYDPATDTRPIVVDIAWTSARKWCAALGGWEVCKTLFAAPAAASTSAPAHPLPAG